MRRKLPAPASLLVCFGTPAVLTALCPIEHQGPLEPVYRAALALGTANQLTNILRDVGEDAAERNRIYVPVDELDQFGISEAEVRVAQAMCERSNSARTGWHLIVWAATLPAPSRLIKLKNEK